MIHRDLLYAGQKKTFSDEILSCRRTILEKFDASSILGISIFINAKSDNDFFEKKVKALTLLKDKFGNVPISIISQSAGKQTAAEVWIHDSADSLEHKCTNNISYTLYADNFGKSIFALGLSSEEVLLSVDQQSSDAFEKMKAILDAENFTMDNVIRQWNYIPDILKKIEKDSQIFQYYQIFNNIRQEYYSAHKKETHYPAATGIGMNYGNVTIDFIATKAALGLQCISVTNPRQIDAYDYNQKLLVGTAPNKKPPLFARAKFIGNSEKSLAFVSGTASIIGEETQGIGDIKAQTRITIENIEKLISKENCINTIGKQIKEISYKFNRVYIKRAKDFPDVIEICREVYGNTPTLYVLADICRDNLLVEIECDISISM